jgi:mRNA interferase MazF
MTRGDIYRTREALAERGGKRGFYLVVSRAFVAENPDIETVICAPIYSEILGVTTEVIVGPAEGLPKTSSVRCDFLALLFKAKLTHFVGSVSLPKLKALDRALAIALDLPTSV